MIVPAPIAQDKLARDQFTNTFILNNIVLSAIDVPVPTTHVMVARDSTSAEPSVPVAIGGILGGVAFVLLLAALAYFLWRVRQGRVHVERIGLAHFSPRQRFTRHASHTSSFSVTKIQTRPTVSTETYNPETALPWSLLRTYRPTAPTAPAPVTLPLPRINGAGSDTPSTPERARVIDSYPEEPQRLVAPAFYQTSRSNNNTPIPHTPPPAWRSLSPRPPTYDSDEGPSSSGH